MPQIRLKTPPSHGQTEPPVLAAGHFGTGVAHGFSTRAGGVSPAPFDSLNLGPAGEDTRENILENFDRFCHAVGVNRADLVLSRQVHEDHVQPVTRAERGQGLETPVPRARDGLMTRTPGVALCVFSADCVPILLYDPDTPAIAAIHAGWRGTARGIVNKAVHAMTEQYGTNPAHLLAAIGPSIGACCFLTHNDVYEPMKEAFDTDISRFVNRFEDRWSIDLKGLNALWLTQAGVAPERMALSDHCTCCRDDLFFSHRRMGAKRGLMAAVIQIGENPL